MINVCYSPLRTTLQGNVTQEIDKALDQLLSFQSTGYLFSTKVASGEWDGMRRFYSTKTHSFKSGLIHKVLKYLTEADIEFQIVNFYTSPRQPQQGDYILRPHQEDGVAAMFNAVRGILQSPPRSGKTMMAGAFLDQSRRFPAIFMCNSIDIASQTRDAFLKYIPHTHIGFVGDGEFDLGDVTVMTVQSAVAAYEVEYKSRRKVSREQRGRAYKKIGSENPLTNDQRDRLRAYIDDTKTMFYDECHHAQSSIAVTIFNKLRKAEFIFGLSATPNYGTPEDMIIEATIGEVFYIVDYHYLIKQGYLLHPKIFLYKLPKVPTVSSVYQTIHKQAIVDNEFRNTLIARITVKLNRMGMSVLIIVDKKTHGNNIYDLLMQTGSADVVRLYGEADLRTRNTIKDSLNRGLLKCVISTLWDEGADIPGLHYVINAAGGASPVDTFQRLRSITPNPDDSNKTYGGLIEFMHREKFLMSHCNFRKKQYESQPDFEMHVRDVSKWSLQNVKDSFR